MISLGQKKFTFFNQVAYTLNGVGDLGGYKVDAGTSVELIKKSSLIFKFGVTETKGSELLLRYYREYQNNAALTATFAFNRKLAITRWLSFEPEVGFILRSHRWTILTGNGYIAIGERYIPPNSSGQWTDKTIGYHIQFPFVFRVNSLISVPLFAEYENDTFGYTFFSVGTGLKFNLSK
jgi:hypothetical protein